MGKRRGTLHRLAPLLFLTFPCFAQPGVVAVAQAIQAALNPGPPMYTNVYGSPGPEFWSPITCAPPITIPYTAFSLSSATASVSLLTVPDRWSPTVVEVEETAQFLLLAPPRTMSYWVEGCVGCGWYYIPPTPLGQVPPKNWAFSGAAGQPALLTSHSPALTIQIQGTNPGTLKDLTSGSFTVRFCGIQLHGDALPAYSPMPQSRWTNGTKTCTSTYNPYPFPPGGSPWIARCL